MHSGMFAFPLILLLSFFGAPVCAQTQVPTPTSTVPEPLPDAAVQDLETIVVTGRQPGPGLWKVSRGDRVMWILGTQNPLPKRMEWDSAQIEKRIRESQEVLLPPIGDLNFNVGFFKKLTLLPSALKVRKNPDGKSLQDMVPPAQYATWKVLKKRWIGDDDDVEEWRPMFAALELYGKAIKKSGMTVDTGVLDLVKRTAKKSDVSITTPTVVININDPKAALKEFSRLEIDDQECFRKTLDAIESDLGTMAARANAWATGDIEALRELPYQNQFTECNEALTGNAVARKQGLGDIRAQLERKWMDAAEAALNKNKVTFAVLNMGTLLASNGYLAKLVAKGYMIEEP